MHNDKHYGSTITPTFNRVIYDWYCDSKRRVKYENDVMIVYHQGQDLSVEDLIDVIW